MAVNRNKRGICLDLSRQTDRLAACELIAGADVVVESFRPGVMDRLAGDERTGSGVDLLLDHRLR